MSLGRACNLGVATSGWAEQGGEALGAHLRSGLQARLMGAVRKALASLTVGEALPRFIPGQPPAAGGAGVLFQPEHVCGSLGSRLRAL